MNRFPILLNALTTTKLSTATKTFMVCCILHNLCIDERLASVSSSPESGLRYTQTSQQRLRDLIEDDDFEFVERVDEEVADELSRLHALTDPVIGDDEGVSVKEKMVWKIAASGYMRPKRGK